MKKELLKIAKMLSKSEQTKVLGGLSNGEEDPIINEPSPYKGYCYGYDAMISCDRKCPDGSDPICPAHM